LSIRDKNSQEIPSLSIRNKNSQEIQPQSIRDKNSQEIPRENLAQIRKSAEIPPIFHENPESVDEEK